MMRILIQLLYPIASIVWCFLQILILLYLLNTTAWWRPIAIVVDALFGCLHLISIGFYSKKITLCAMCENQPQAYKN